MRRLLASVRWDVVRQYRYRFYAVSLFVVVIWGVLLSLLGEVARPVAAVAVPAFVCSNLVITTFYFMAALLLLEKDEGTLAALGVTPLRRGEYLGAKVLTLTLLGLVESLLVVGLLFGTDLHWGLLTAGTALLGAFYTLAGFIFIVRYDAINAFLLPSVGVVMFLFLPLLPHFGMAARWPFYLHPVEPALTLMRAAYAPAGAGTLAYGLLGLVGWCAGAAWWAMRRFDRLV